MTRMMAIVEREIRKFFRSPALMMVSMMLPLVRWSSSATPSAARSAMHGWRSLTTTAARKR